MLHENYSDLVTSVNIMAPNSNAATTHQIYKGMISETPFTNKV